MNEMRAEIVVEVEQMAEARWLRDDVFQCGKRLWIHLWIQWILGHIIFKEEIFKNVLNLLSGI